jgi:hypothetical protein
LYDQCAIFEIDVIKEQERDRERERERGACLSQSALCNSAGGRMILRKENAVLKRNGLIVLAALTLC